MLGIKKIAIQLLHWIIFITWDVGIESLCWPPPHTLLPPYLRTCHKYLWRHLNNVNWTDKTSFWGETSRESREVTNWETATSSSQINMRCLIMLIIKLSKFVVIMRPVQPGLSAIWEFICLYIYLFIPTSFGQYFQIFLCLFFHFFFYMYLYFYPCFSPYLFYYIFYLCEPLCDQCLWKVLYK